MALHLALILPSLVGPSQKRFIKSRSAIGNIRKVLTVLNRVRHRPIPDKHPVLNAEKAFDNVHWDWLGLILVRMKIQGKFHTLLGGLYRHPTAQLHTPGFLSPSFALFKVTRQGCPLSPLLFDLALETLARCLEDTKVYESIIQKGGRRSGSEAI